MSQILGYVNQINRKIKAMKIAKHIP